MPGGNYTRDDLIYLAGLFDGEGCVQLYPTNRRNRVNDWTTRICIYNTDGRLMIWLESTFGGAVSVRKREYPNRSVYEWKLQARKFEYLLKELVPFLKIKKDQVEYLLEFLTLSQPDNEDRLELVADIQEEKWKVYPYIKAV